MKVPFADLSRQHQRIQSELESAFRRTLAANDFILGAETERFEEAFAASIGRRFAVGCSNGTDALILALRAGGVLCGDEVLTVSHTFFATVEAIYALGAKPILVDIDRRTGLMDLSAIERVITSKTKAIVPVHLYGQPVPMDPLLKICSERDILCVEDAAQAHGASYRGRAAGSFGTLAAFSFYPGKNLGALGDAGAVVTDDESLAKSLRSLRNHGRREKYLHDSVASNMRMDGLQAAFLSEKLPLLREGCERRRTIASEYRKGLRGVEGIELLEVLPEVEHAYHLFVVLTPDREALRKRLAECGVETGVHYPLGCHQQPALTHLGIALPVTEEFSRTCLSLPMFPEMTSDEVAYVVECVRRCA